jgi:hypothetical protein
MPIVLNGTTFNNGGTAKFNGTSLTEIKFGSTTVWKKQYSIIGSSAEYTGGLTKPTGNPYINRGNATPVYTPTTSGSKITKFVLSCTTNYPNGGGVIEVYSTSKVSLTGYSKLYFKLSGITTYNTSHINVGVASTYNDPGTSWCPSGWTAITNGGGNSMMITRTAEKDVNLGSGAGTYNFDISSLSGSYYVCFCLWVASGDGNSNMSTVTVSDVYLE